MGPHLSDWRQGNAFRDAGGLSRYRTRGGKIINFGSIWADGQSGNRGVQLEQRGIRGLSRTAARELGKYGITVNVINPTLSNRYDLTPS